jgi:hypothetical protein
LTTKARRGCRQTLTGGNPTRVTTYTTPNESFQPTIGNGRIGMCNCRSQVHVIVVDRAYSRMGGMQLLAGMFQTRICR